MPLVVFFFFNDTATTEIYTLSLHDALPISLQGVWRPFFSRRAVIGLVPSKLTYSHHRSEEHTSELQSQSNLVCRLLLEKKKHRASPARASPRPAQTAPTSVPVHESPPTPHL